MSKSLISMIACVLLFIWVIAAFHAMPDKPANPKWRLLPHPKVRVVFVAYTALAGSLLIAIFGRNYTGILLQGYIKDFYPNIASELASVAITILVINKFIEQSENQKEKERIIRQIGSRSNDFALEAVRIAHEQGWLTDGSLKGANFAHANLENAHLSLSDLEGANLYAAKLKGCHLYKR